MASGRPSAQCLNDRENDATFCGCTINYLQCLQKKCVSELKAVEYYMYNLRLCPTWRERRSYVPVKEGLAGLIIGKLFSCQHKKQQSRWTGLHCANVVRQWDLVLWFYNTVLLLGWWSPKYSTKEIGQGQLKRAHATENIFRSLARNLCAQNSEAQNQIQSREKQNCIGPLCVFRKCISNEEFFSLPKWQLFSRSKPKCHKFCCKKMFYMFIDIIISIIRMLNIKDQICNNRVNTAIVAHLQKKGIIKG